MSPTPPRRSCRDAWERRPSRGCLSPPRPSQPSLSRSSHFLGQNGVEILSSKPSPIANSLRLARPLPRSMISYSAATAGHSFQVFVPPRIISPLKNVADGQCNLESCSEIIALDIQAASPHARPRLAAVLLASDQSALRPGGLCMASSTPRPPPPSSQSRPLFSRRRRVRVPSPARPAFFTLRHSSS